MEVLDKIMKKAKTATVIQDGFMVRTSDNKIHIFNKWADKSVHYMGVVDNPQE